MPKGISIEQFCSRNKVPYNIFYKWYKDTRNKIVEVKVDGLPTSAQEEPKQESSSQEPSSTVTKPSGVRILVELRMTNGLHISQKNLSYQELKRLIEKLEGLCWVLPVLTASIISVTLRICDANIVVYCRSYVSNFTVNQMMVMYL